ncbi:hypothetical protein [Undibacterium umbellatum]|uniref:Uncharacterized protein n=1 Tax=Undibacterium umbellatum TaxID=2762300 RepID=A0ABR6Z818_9BURK|nr:hypothetical protein [Undibacterium umbellatum]MBC3907895.1 hypothetical protein [Undibacterium umbellatum]
MSSILERQAQLDFDIANALIMATPESWTSAEMEVERDESSGIEKISVLIFNNEGSKEIVQGTDDIYDGLYKLSGLLRDNGANIWVRALYSVAMDDNKNWKYKAKFEY